MERRAFLTRVMPACALGGLGICEPTNLAAFGAEAPPCQEKHKFDEDFPYPLTLCQYMSRQLRSGAEVLKAFEINVTECLLAEPMLELDAGKIGNAWLCDEDYGYARGFNPRITLIRDKTLMLGDSCCNLSLLSDVIVY